jgi:hypothetical protein
MISGKPFGTGCIVSYNNANSGIEQSQFDLKFKTTYQVSVVLFLVAWPTSFLPALRQI